MTAHEHHEQVAVVDWFALRSAAIPALRLGDGRPAMFAVPNGGARHIATATKLRDEGVSRGVPDLHVPALHLWIEMKRAKGGRVSPEQFAWVEYLRALGDSVIIAAGAQEAIAAIERAIKARGI